MAKGVVDQVGATLAAQLAVEDRAAARDLRTSERLDPPAGLVGRFARVLAGVRLDELVAGPVALVRRADQLGERVRVLRAESERHRDGLVVRVAAGELDLADADLVADSMRYRALQPDGPVSTVAGNAAAGLRSDAEAELRRVAPEIMAELSRAAADAVAESVKLVKGLPSGVDDDHGAFADPEVIPQWTRLRQLVDRFVLLHEVAEHLRDAGMAPRLALGAEFAEVDMLAPTPVIWTKYEQPFRLPQNYMQEHPCLRLATAVRAGAGPCLRDAGQANQAYWQHMKKQHDDTVRRVRRSAGVA